MKIFVLSIFAYSLMSCGSPVNTESLVSSDNIVEKPLMIVVGGRHSCGIDGFGDENPIGSQLYNEVLNLNERLEEGGKETLDFLVSCHQQSTNLAYVNSFDERPTMERSEENLRGVILDRMESHGNDKIFFVGHSYGGWILMDMGWQLESGNEFSHLYTIDPISKKLCSFSTPMGCLDAPEDIVGSQRRRIARHTGKWVQFYQDTTSYLHSSFIEEADVNVKIEAPHIEIDVHEAVWNRIFEDVELI